MIKNLMHFPVIPPGLLDEAFEKFRSKEFEEAYKLFISAYQLDNANPLLGYYIGATLSKLGRRKEAQRFFRKVLQNEKTDEPLGRDALIRLIELDFDMFRRMRESFPSEPVSCSGCGNPMRVISENLNARLSLDLEFFCSFCARTFKSTQKKQSGK